MSNASPNSSAIVGAFPNALGELVSPNCYEAKGSGCRRERLISAAKGLGWRRSAVNGKRGSLWSLLKRYPIRSGSRKKPRSRWSIEIRPGPQAMMPSAMAAQVRWTGHPSGTVSSTIAVMNSNPSAANHSI
jgi:hypothetical protein